MTPRRGISPVTTFHNQTGLLLISFTWGLSYMMPGKYRVPFSEVFPDILGSDTAMRWWGLVLVVFATTALVAERVCDRWYPFQAKFLPGWWWRTVWFSHLVLAAAYAILSASAI